MGNEVDNVSLRGFIYSLACGQRIMFVPCERIYNYYFPKHQRKKGRVSTLTSPSKLSQMIAQFSRQLFSTNVRIMLKTHIGDKTKF